LPQRSRSANPFKTAAGFYDNNASGTISLLLAAQAAGVDKIVFSSTCATSGIPVSMPMGEGHPQLPINRYVGAS
jgi:UDP-glucose 4-epimerase